MTLIAPQLKVTTSLVLRCMKVDLKTWVVGGLAAVNVMLLILFLSLFAVTSGGAQAPDQNSLKQISPIIVRFGPVVEVVKKSAAFDEAITNAKRHFLQTNQFVLDATVSTRKGKLWCKSVTTNSFTSIFRENNFSTNNLNRLRDATVAEMASEWGDPEVMEAVYDSHNTVIWQWRVCNGKAGSAFQATELTVGFGTMNGWLTNKNSIRFLLVRTNKEDSKKQK